jgi:hypothetical protein
LLLVPRIAQEAPIGAWTDAMQHAVLASPAVVEKCTDRVHAASG